MTLDFSILLDIQKKWEILGKNPEKLWFLCPEKIQNSGSKKGTVGRCRKKETGCRKKWFTTVQSGVGEKAPFGGNQVQQPGVGKKAPLGAYQV